MTHRRMSSVRRAFVALVLTAASACVASLQAQTVHGQIREVTGTLVSGAVITLFRADGTRVGSSLSAEDGRYSLRAPSAGSYLLEVKRIGIRVIRVGPFELSEADSRTEDVTVRPIPPLQPEVRVSGRTRCVIQPEANSATATVWGNARAALQAVRITEQGRLVHADVVRFARDLDASTFRVLKEERRESFTYGERPFVSAPPEELSRLGYVRREGNGFVYFAPDVSVILSDVFLAEHCFRLVKGSGADSANVGLSFEPVRGREISDISGSLWIDKRTSELRSLVFLYENPPSPHERGQAGGSLRFRRLPSGAWIVDRWTIRWPRFAGNTRRDPASTAVVLGDRTSTAVASYREEGGEATLVQSEDVGFGVLRGRVIDGDRGQATPNAHVTLTRGGFVQTRLDADGDGRFLADTLPPGTYEVAVSSLRLDSLGISARSRQVSIRARDSLALDLSLPSEDTVWPALCPGTTPSPDAGILRVLVIDGVQGEAWSGATVRAVWEGRAAGAVTGVTDDDGVWTFCNLPVGLKLRVTLVSGTREILRRDMKLNPASILVVPLAAPVVR